MGRKSRPRLTDWPRHYFELISNSFFESIWRDVSQSLKSCGSFFFFTKSVAYRISSPGQHPIRCGKWHARDRPRPSRPGKLTGWIKFVRNTWRNGSKPLSNHVSTMEPRSILPYRWRNYDFSLSWKVPSSMRLPSRGIDNWTRIWKLLCANSLLIKQRIHSVLRLVRLSPKRAEHTESIGLYPKIWPKGIDRLTCQGTEIITNQTDWKHGRFWRRSKSIRNANIHCGGTRYNGIQFINGLGVARPTPAGSPKSIRRDQNKGFP